MELDTDKPIEQDIDKELADLASKSTPKKFMRLDLVSTRCYIEWNRE